MIVQHCGITLYVSGRGLKLDVFLSLKTDFLVLLKDIKLYDSH